MKVNLKALTSHTILACVAVLAFRMISGGGSQSSGNAFVPTAHAAKVVQPCTLADSAGTYMAKSEGNGNFGRQVSVSTLTSDGAGNFTGTATASINGQIFQNVAFSGTLTVNPDCTYNATSTDQFGNVTHDSGVVLGKGEETYSIRTDPGTTISTYFKRMN